jgi:dTDP-4-dehydrorhamnose 3,5-epimerase-like enzyme
VELTIIELKDSGDERGNSFRVPDGCFGEAFTVRDVHLTTLQPGHIRGNHFHVARNEKLMVMSTDRWSLHWDSGGGTPVEVRVFDGPSAVLVYVPPYASHAIRNDGNKPLQIIGLTDGLYDPASPDTFTRRVTSP